MSASRRVLLAFLGRRVAHAVTVIVVVATATFALVHLAPGGPSILADPKLGAAERAALERELGLDQPLPMQYGRWLARATRGDLGRSFLYQTPTLETVASRLPKTLLLAGTALVLTLLIAIPLGTYSAAHRGGTADRIFSGVSFMAMAVPTFWLAIASIFLFAVVLRVLPAGGASTAGSEPSVADTARHLVLPAVVLAAAFTAELFRHTRSSVSTVLVQPFVRTARASGVPNRQVRGRHALRNALLPIITLVGLLLPRLVGGAAITETVFAWPGMGRLGVEAALSRDYPVVMAITLLVSVGVVVVNIVVDLCYAWADPRIRLTS